MPIAVHALLAGVVAVLPLGALMVFGGCLLRLRLMGRRPGVWLWLGAALYVASMLMLCWPGFDELHSLIAGHLRRRREIWPVLLSLATLWPAARLLMGGALDGIEGSWLPSFASVALIEGAGCLGWVALSRPALTSLLDPYGMAWIAAATAVGLFGFAVIEAAKKGGARLRVRSCLFLTLCAAGASAALARWLQSLWLDLPRPGWMAVPAVFLWLIGLLVRYKVDVNAALLLGDAGFCGLKPRLLRDFAATLLLLCLPSLSGLIVALLLRSVRWVFGW